MFVIPALSRNPERFRLDSRLPPVRLKRIKGGQVAGMKKESGNDGMFIYFFNHQ